ncbi:hypothetical protein [Mycobacterium sp. BK086]|uniref:hypothetical protein n=1 Tax=Mycobacterium sp. BK086 TaxID=2512165 RepID=UPI00105F40E4|nr:hypothetical protein [Mycobacterium sp. BK086]
MTELGAAKIEPFDETVVVGTATDQVDPQHRRAVHCTSSFFDIFVSMMLTMRSGDTRVRT